MICDFDCFCFDFYFLVGGDLGVGGLGFVGCDYWVLVGVCGWICVLFWVVF